MASNDDDRRQRRKQGGVVGAAASKTQVPPKARCGCWVPQPDSGAHSKSSRLPPQVKIASGGKKVYTIKKPAVHRPQGRMRGMKP